MKETKFDIRTLIFFLLTAFIFIFNLNANSFLGIPAYLWTNGLIVLFIGYTFVVCMYNGGKLYWDKIFTYSLLFVVMCFISILYSYNSDDTQRKTFTMVVVVIMAICIYQYVIEEEMIRLALKAYSWAGFVAAIYLFANSNISFTTLGDASRLGGAIGDANLVGITYVFASTVAIHLLKTEPRKAKPIYIIQIAVMGFAVLMTGSRTAFVLLLVAIVGNLFLSAYKKHWNFIKVFALVIGVGIILGLALYAVMNIEALYNVLGIRLLSFWQIMNGEESIYREGSTETRALFARRAWEWFLNSPLWLGHGIAAFGSYNQTFADGWYCFCHCGYLEILCGLGIPGVIFFYVPFVKCIKAARVETEDEMTSEYCILIATLALEFMLGDILTVMYYMKSTWILVGLLAGLYMKINTMTNSLNSEIDLDIRE